MAGPRLEGWVLDLLRCPVTGEPLEGPVEVDGQPFLRTAAGVRYPVVDGVPVLLADAALDVPAGTGPHDGGPHDDGPHDDGPHDDGPHDDGEGTQP